MTHTQKIKLARKMMTHEEIVTGCPLFQSKAWDKKSAAIRKRELNKKEHVKI